MGRQDNAPGEPMNGGEVPRKALARVGRPTEAAAMLDDPFLGLSELAKYSNLSVRTLARHIGDAKHPLPTYKVRGKILVRRSEFDRWIESFRRRPHQAMPRLVDDVLAKFRP